MGNSVKLGATSVLVISEARFVELHKTGHIKIGAGAKVVVAPSSEESFLAKVRELVEGKVI